MSIDGINTPIASYPLQIEVAESSLFHIFDDTRPCHLRIWHVVQACFILIGDWFRMLYRVICFSISHNELAFPIAIQDEDGKSSFDLTRLPWNMQAEGESEGLYLFIHGLRGTPIRWVEYINQLEQSNPDFHCLAPYVPLKGNCPLEDATEPYLAIVEDYMAKFPGKPIHLVGLSNGARMASYIETKLKSESLHDTSLSVVSIAGIHGGTKLVDRLESIGLLSWGCLHPQIEDAFHFNSDFAQNMVQEWQDKQEVWKTHGVSVRHLFYATTEDEFVHPTQSSLPKLPGTREEDYRVWHGYTHNTIADGVRNDVLEWLRN